MADVPLFRLLGGLSGWDRKPHLFGFSYDLGVFSTVHPHSLGVEFVFFIGFSWFFL